MTIKPIFQPLNFPLHAGVQNTNKYTYSPRSLDLRPIHFASIINRSNTQSTSEASSSYEILREMGRKTFHYKNPPTTEEVIDWREKTDKELEVFVSKASMLAIVKNMDSKIDESKAMEIVKEACDTKRDIYTVFMEKGGCNLNWWGRFCCRWTYFLYYRSGILPNTLDTFMQTFMGKIRSELVQKDGGKNLTFLNDKLLTETNSFLDFYIIAVDNYANGIDLQGSRDVHISKEFDKKQTIPIEKLCDKFAEISVREFVPRVHFFKQSQFSSYAFARFLGWFLDSTMGWAFNQLLLRPILRKKIPAIIQSLVKSSTDAAQPTNLPFVVSITQGMLEQLRKFRIQIEQSDSDIPLPSSSVAGTAQLPEVVKKFIEVLQKEPFKTRKDLLENRNAKPPGFFASYVAKGIEDSIIEGCQALLSFLSTPGNSEEIFYRLLNLSNAPFDSPPLSTEELKVKYTALQKEMRDEARGVIQTLASRAVKSQGLPEKQVQKIRKNSENQKREKAIDTSSQLAAHSQALDQKIQSLFTISHETLNQLQGYCQILQDQGNIPQQSLSLLSDTLANICPQTILPSTDVNNIKRAFREIEKHLPLSGENRTQYLQMKTHFDLSIQKPEMLNILEELNGMVGVVDSYTNNAVLEEGKLEETKNFPFFDQGWNRSCDPSCISDHGSFARPDWSNKITPRTDLFHVVDRQ